MYTNSFGQEFEIESIDSHRNGVGGAGFVVAIINVTKADGDPDSLGRFVTTSFHGYGGEADRNRSLRRNLFIENTSALKIDLLPDIEFAAGNSWRGSDMFGEAIATEWERVCGEGSYAYDPFGG